VGMHPSIRLDQPMCLTYLSDGRDPIANKTRDLRVVAIFTVVVVVVVVVVVLAIYISKAQMVVYL